MSFTFYILYNHIESEVYNFIMSLRIWLPLISDWKNQGTEPVGFSLVSSNTAINANGKLGKCYSNNSNTAGGLVSNATVNLGTTQSMFCWFKFTSLMSNSSLGGAMVTQHRYQKNTGMGITIKYESSTTGYLSVNTATGSSRTYNTYCCPTLLQANTWYHGGFTYDGTNVLKIYLNGTCAYTNNIGKMSCPADYIGVFAWSLGGTSGATLHTNYKLNGSLNDVRIYDECISDQQIAEIAKGLMLHYPLDDTTLEDTTNLCSVQYLSAGSSGGWGGHSGTVTIVDSSEFPLPCDKCDKLVVSYSGSSGGGWGRGVQNITNITSSTIYTCSFFFKTSENFTSANLANLIYIREYNSDGTQISEAGKWSISNKKYICDGWYRVWGTFTTKPTTVKIQPCVYVYPNSNQEYYFGCWQVEKLNHMTPYVLGSRTNRNFFDCSGYKYNGTSTGTLTIYSDSVRYSYSTLFANGKTNYTSTQITVGSGTSITISIWVKSLDGSTGTGNYHIIFDVNSGRYEFSIPTTGKFRQGMYINGVRKVDDYGTVNLLDTNWHMLTATFDGESIRRYVDGQLVNTTSASGTSVTGDLTMRLGNYGDTRYGDVNILKNDLRIYATCLSAEQISELYNSPVVRN